MKKYIDKIKELFFTEYDRGVRYPDDYNREMALNMKLINEGAQSQTLMSNPIFQESVADIYLALEAQLDSIEDTEPGAHERIMFVRAQRRALRVICAALDNKIALKETVEKSLKEVNVDES